LEFHNKIKETAQKNKTLLSVLLILVLIFIPVFTATYIRLVPVNTPLVDQIAENNVNSYFKNQLTSQVQSKYPNLPSQNIQTLVDQEFANFQTQNKDMLAQQSKAAADQIRSRFENDQGEPYLIDIDTYLWYEEARNVHEKGMRGDSIVNGKSWNTLRNGRYGQDYSAFYLHPWLIGMSYKLVEKISSMSLMGYMFIFSAIIIALSIIPMFFMGRAIGGNVGGFFAAFYYGVHAALVTRSSGGFADTDPYNAVFPIAILCLFMYALNAKKTWVRALFAVLSGLFVAVYSVAWGGWWYIFDFIIGGALAFIAVEALKRVSVKTLLAQSESLGIFIVSSALFTSLFSGISFFLTFINGPINFIVYKSVGITSVWPNVLTTVAELNLVEFSNVINVIGGGLMFVLSLLGILTLLLPEKFNKMDQYLFFGSFFWYLAVLGLKSTLPSLVLVGMIAIPCAIAMLLHIKDKKEHNLSVGIILTLWIVATLFASTRGIRFTALAVPVVCIGFAAFASFLYKKAGDFSKELSISDIAGKSIVVIMFLLLLISPTKAAYNIVYNELPSFDDAFYSSMIKIKDNTTDAMITSWWDFGHYFTAIAERKVTFDGGDQGERIYWAGKSLLESDENMSVGILRTLNCAQEKAPHTLESFGLQDRDAIDLLLKAIHLDKEGARKTFKAAGLTDAQTEQILAQTHCSNLIPQFYVTSGDMIGKSGVWAHFGSWNFTRADMFQVTHDKTYDEGMKLLQGEFNLSEQEASRYYNEIQTTPGDQWIAPWPSYVATPQACTINGTKVSCNIPVQGGVTSATWDKESDKMSFTYITPAHVYIVDENSTRMQSFDSKTQLDFAIYHFQGGYYIIPAQYPLTTSIFTRLYFFDGIGLKKFHKFDDQTTITGSKLITWTVDLES